MIPDSRCQVALSSCRRCFAVPRAMVRFRPSTACWRRRGTLSPAAAAAAAPAAPAALPVPAAAAEPEAVAPSRAATSHLLTATCSGGRLSGVAAAV
eukprot:163105-Chlamydomonas_euryale.AAC.1